MTTTPTNSIQIAMCIAAADGWDCARKTETRVDAIMKYRSSEFKEGSKAFRDHRSAELENPYPLTKQTTRQHFEWAAGWRTRENDTRRTTRIRIQFSSRFHDAALRRWASSSRRRIRRNLSR